MSHPFTMPTIPADLAEIIPTHKALSGGYTMTAGAPEGGSEPPVDPAPNAADEPLGDKGLKALQAERDARQKAEQEAATLRKQIEDASKTAEQKAADELRAATALAEGAALKALKYEVAAEKGIDLKLAGRLDGTTKAELEADADNLKTLIGAKPGATPKPDPSQGSGGDDQKPTGVGAGRDLYRDTHSSKKTS